VTRYSRQDVLRILRITQRQLQGWERSGLIASLESFGFTELSQLRMLRELERKRMSPASIQRSVAAMRAVSGMANPLLQSTVMPSGGRLVFRTEGALVDPIRRQLVFDFEPRGAESRTLFMAETQAVSPGIAGVQQLFFKAIQAEEAGEQTLAIELYTRLLELSPAFPAALINLGTIHYHAGRFQVAEQLYRRATLADPHYVLAFFDLGNVLDELKRSEESIQAYEAALRLAPDYADAHYNLAMAYERKGLRRRALEHWRQYLRLDRTGPWAEHARTQLRKLLSREKLAITHRAKSFRAAGGRAASRLELVANVTG
jgi:tetratricopeptide (TPR) repeat protein